MRSTRLSMKTASILLALVCALAGCKTKDLLYCENDTYCDRFAGKTFCDVHGEYPESEGIGKTCIAPPFDAAVPDAASIDSRASTPDAPVDTMPDAKPCSALIAFLAKNAAGHLNIFTMTADGQNVTNLTMNNSGDDSLFMWSPDGQYLAFASSRGGRTKIYTMTKDGSDLVNVSNDQTHYHSYPAWAPSGIQLAFNRENLNTIDIMTANRNGTGLQNLTNDTSLDESPAWSPDGQLIAFSSFRNGKEFQTFWMS